MSERESFVTEYIYCEECFKIIEDKIKQNFKNSTSIARVVTGLGHGSYDSQTVDDIKEIFKDSNLCHSIKFVVIPEDKNEIAFVIEKGE